MVFWNQVIQFMWIELFLMFWSFNIVFTQFSVTKKVPEDTFPKDVMLLASVSLKQAAFLMKDKKISC